MKERIHEILMNLNRGRIAVSEAQQQLLDLFGAAGKSEQLFCQKVIHHNCKHFDIIGCIGCTVKKFEAK